MSFYRNLLSSTGRKKNEPLCFTSLQDGSSVAFGDYMEQENAFFISRDNVNWEQWDYSEISLDEGDKIYMIGNNPNGLATKYEEQEYASYFVIEGKVECSGNIMSLLGEDITEIPCIGCFAWLFFGCDGLISAPKLPATKLAESCYADMFADCTSLVNAPSLPAIELASNCYNSMFRGCTSIVNAPSLPATKLSKYCYSIMFYDCQSLVNAPELPATKLAESCYVGMFYGCSSLKSISVKALDWDEKFASHWVNGVSEDGVFYRPLGVEIPRGVSGVPEGWTEDNDHFCITAVSDCNVYMSDPYGEGEVDLYYTLDEQNWIHWNGSRIELNANSKVYFKGTNKFLSYYNSNKDSVLYRFQISGTYDVSGNIMSLISFAKDLKDAPYCFAELFHGQNIRDASRLRLPAMILSRNCYGAMFIGSDIVNAPQLPATKLADECYYRMYSACYSLENVPALPAAELANDCYYEMFDRCTSLKKIEVYFRDWTTNSFTNWVDGVGTDGIFICPKELPIERGASRIPEGWLVRNEFSAEPLCFTSLQNGSFVAFDDCMEQENIFYISRDKSNWTRWDYSEIVLNDGEKVYMIGNNPNGISTKYEEYEEASFFVIVGRIECSGNIMSLLGDDITEIPCVGCFAYLFDRCRGLVSAPELPATKLADYCYQGMFGYCSSLVNAPSSLPAIKLSHWCYVYMFDECTSLVNAPALPATELAEACYSSMFYRCTSLVNAPALPATELSKYCYSEMFARCTSLVNAPALPATTLANDCYSYMFKGCTSLKHIDVKALDWDANTFKSWVENVSPTGTFVKSPLLDIPFGTSGIPEGWTVVNV